MPLIALDILDGKVKELMLVIKQLKEENEELKKRMSSAVPGEISPEMVYELEKMKKLVSRYKTERTALYTKVAAAVKKLDNMIEKGQNG